MNTSSETTPTTTEQAALRTELLKITSAIEKDANGSFVPAQIVRRYHDELDRLDRQLTGSNLPLILNWREWQLEELPIPPMLIDGILHLGNKMVIGGGSKSFKTWALTDLAISIASGKPWWGFNTVKMPVLYVNFEIQPCFYHQRIRNILHSRSISISDDFLQVWNMRGYAGPSCKVIPQIIEEINRQGKQYGLVVLDPTYKLLGDGADENSAGDIGQMMNDFERVSVDTGAGIAFGAHFSKGNQAGKESIDRISGSGVFARDPDVILTMTRHESDDCFTVESTLRNCPPIEPFVIQWNHPFFERADKLNPDDLRQVPTGKKQAPSVSIDEFADWIPTKGDISSDALELRAQSDRLGKNKVLNYLNVLVERKLIFEIKTPRPGVRPRITYSKTEPVLI